MPEIGLSIYVDEKKRSYSRLSIILVKRKVVIQKQ